VQSHAGKVGQLFIPKAFYDQVRDAVGEFQKLKRLLH